MNETKLTTKNYLLIASVLFGLFFGAGNLIFPLHLGQLAGSHWLAAALGFLVTAVVLPLLSVLAVAAMRAEGVYDIGLPLGKWFAVLFMVLIHLTIGPLFGTPRTATVAFTTGFAPMLAKAHQGPGLLVFSGLFFLAAFLLSYKEQTITGAIGKLLNPLFLVLLFFFIFFGFTHSGGAASMQANTPAYAGFGQGFFNGFLEGYNTMDALAGLAFGVTVVTAIRGLGVTREAQVAKVTAKAGVLATGMIGLVYLLLIVLGAQSLATFKLSAEGGTAFNQLVTLYFGAAGHALLATLLTITCLTTAVGLVAAFAQDFHHHFPVLSYVQWLALMSFASFLTANFGLATIIAWSTPMLMFLYPFAMVLILLSVLGHFFRHDSLVYAFVMGFTTLPALLDMVAAFPPVVSHSAVGLALTHWRNQLLPFATMGMGWVVPALVGLALGLGAYAYRNRANTRDRVTD